MPIGGFDDEQATVAEEGVGASRIVGVGFAEHEVGTRGQRGVSELEAVEEVDVVLRPVIDTSIMRCIVRLLG